VKLLGEKARRCTMCGISWPEPFKRCYQCGGATDLFKGKPTITVEEAESIKKHYEFEQYLEKEGLA
jgi:hypothetical protein